MKLHIKCYCDIDIPKNDYRLFYATRVNFMGGFNKTFVISMKYWNQIPSELIYKKIINIQYIEN